MKVNQLLLTEKEMFSRLHMFMFCYENIEVKTNTSFIGFVDESDNDKCSREWRIIVPQTMFAGIKDKDLLQIAESVTRARGDRTSKYIVSLSPLHLI